MVTRYYPRKTWAALLAMSCADAGIMRDQIRPALRPDTIRTGRVWERWAIWEEQIVQKKEEFISSEDWPDKEILNWIEGAIVGCIQFDENQLSDSAKEYRKFFMIQLRQLADELLNWRYINPEKEK